MNLLNIIKESGGYFEGHTVFKNGQHGDGWIEKGNIFKKHEYFDQFVKEQAKQIAHIFPDVECLVGIKICGSILASHVAKLLNKEYCATYNPEGRFIFHRFNIPKKGSKVVIVDDLVFTGNDIKEVLELHTKYELNTLGISSWINRYSETINNIKIINMLESPFVNTLADDCKLCGNGVSIVYNDIRE